MLRVYEPLSAFSPAQQRLIIAAQERGETRDDVEEREMTEALQRITRPAANPYPLVRTETFRIMAAAKTSTPDDATNLYCPSQLMIRAGLAADALAVGPNSGLAELLLIEEQRETHRERTQEAFVVEDSSGRVHTRSSTWGIPFSWFALFQESDPTEVVEVDGKIATVRVQAELREALERARYTVANLALAAPDLDMLEEVADIILWLEEFDPNARVELDYGSVADRVFPDESPMDVRLGIECLAEGDVTGAAAAYRRLASRWIPIRQLARAS
ncbi:hypothetical protein ACQQCD_05140 [Pseudarthrobacter sp. J1763]|uniref:hypothetical protein n=1 Tax=Pseudarthrobacter sp. J1763 TaxID=3420445 RepID=UPI003D2E1E94